MGLLYVSQDGRMINVGYIGSMNGTGRSRIAPLISRWRELAWQAPTRCDAVCWSAPSTTSVRTT